jgi:transposase
MKKCKPELNDELDGKTKAQLTAICQEEPETFRGTTVVESIAKRFGFNIQWLPPYHPMLNPIEVAWAITKEYVADVNDGSNFQKVKTYIEQGFEKVTSEVWQKLVKRTYRIEEELILKNNIVTAKEVTANPFIINLSSDEDDTFDGDLEDMDIDDIIGEEEITRELTGTFDCLHL